MATAWGQIYCLSWVKGRIPLLPQVEIQVQTAELFLLGLPLLLPVPVPLPLLQLQFLILYNTLQLRAILSKMRYTMRYNTAK